MLKLKWVSFICTELRKEYSKASIIVKSCCTKTTSVKYIHALTLLIIELMESTLCISISSNQCYNTELQKMSGRENTELLLCHREQDFFHFIDITPVATNIQCSRPGVITVGLVLKGCIWIVTWYSLHNNYPCYLQWKCMCLHDANTCIPQMFTTCYMITSNSTKASENWWHPMMDGWDFHF